MLQGVPADRTDSGSVSSGALGHMAGHALSANGAHHNLCNVADMRGVCMSERPVGFMRETEMRNTTL